jgi:hypothetical protein
MKGTDLEKTVEHAKAIFQEIKEKYTGLTGYLVFASPPGSSPWGQCEITGNMSTLLADKKDNQDQEALRNMIQDSIHKREAIELIKQIAEYEDNKKKSHSSKTKGSVDQTIEKMKNDLSLHLEMLEMRDDVLIEVRFDRLLYDLIFALQKDSLVSQEHTPQTKASIQIVLGTVREIHQRIK